MKEENSPSTDAEQVESEQLHAMLEASLSNDSPAPAAADGAERKPKAEPVYEGYPADPDFQLRGGYDNLMLDAAAPLFGLVIRLRTLDALWPAVGGRAGAWTTPRLDPTRARWRQAKQPGAVTATCESFGTGALSESCADHVAE